MGRDDPHPDRAAQELPERREAGLGDGRAGADGELRGGADFGCGEPLSSGSAALDAAALAAVRKAVEFLAAPAEPSKSSYAFSLAIKFSR